MRSFSRWICGLSALLVASGASATTVGLSLVGGGSSWSTNQDGTPVLGSDGTPIPGQSEFSGTKTTAAWALTWDLVGDVDPFVDGVFSVKNNTTSVQTFTFIVTLP